MKTPLIGVVMLLCLTSLHAQTHSFEHKTSTAFEFNITGDSFEDLFRKVTLMKRTAKSVRERINNQQFNITDYVDVIDVLNQVDGIQKYHPDGIQTDFRLTHEFTLRSTILPRDAITFGIGSYTQSAITADVNLDSLFGFRFSNTNGQAWQDDVKNFMMSMGPMLPSSQDGIAFMLALESAGYDGQIAGHLAAMAELENIDFDGLSGDVLLDLLINQLHGTGESYQDGADPSKNNTSKIRNTHVTWQEFGLSYALPATDWLRFTAGVRYIRGVQFTKESLALTYNTKDAKNDLFGSINDSFFPVGDVRQSVGFDASIDIDIGWLQASLTGRNLNSPTLEWESSMVRFDPLITLNTDCYVFGAQVPLVLSMLIDITRVESAVLTGYHRQYFNVGLSIKPEWENVGFGITTGLRKNVAESYEPWVMYGSLGLRLWWFQLNAGGQGTAKRDNIGTFESRSFGFNASLSINLEW